MPVKPRGSISYYPLSASELCYNKDQQEAIPTGTYEQALRLWQSYQIRSAADVDRVLDNFNVLFAYHSGKIENDQITFQDTSDIFQHGKVSGYTGETKALFELQNQKLCYDYLKEKIVARDELDTRLLLEVHRILTSGTYDERRYIENGERPGEFKKHDYVTGIHEVGAPAEQVERELDELMEEVGGYCGPQILRAGAYLHARFENIHPFADGNGRGGRVLLNYFLLTRDHPPVIVFHDDKARYFASLQAYDVWGSLDPMAEFLSYETGKTWEHCLLIQNDNTVPNFSQGLE